ncbi:DNA-binding response regulator [Ktedonobacteria bacterium brp13]|nr:DNA-binding response regulator [Ktedonobacteria bacterium brp13]
MSNIIRVIAVDDHPLVREGLRLMLATSEDLTLVGDAANGSEALQRIEELLPDVVLLDISMPGMDGLEVLKHIRQRWLHVAVLLLTTSNEDEHMVRGLQSGACGYLLKETPIDALFHAIRTAAHGEVVLHPEIMTRVLAHAKNAAIPLEASQLTVTHPSHMELTKREQDVLAGVAQGERSKEIGARLGITERTVRAYLNSIFAKLGVDSRASAVAVAMKYSLLPKK